MIIDFITYINEQIEDDRKYYIYTLSDPIDGEVKYVGKTKDLKDRMWRHMEPSNLKNAWTSKTKWILWLKKQGLKPIMDILDEGDANNINDLERYWISQIKTWGYRLKNDTSGGQGADYWKGKKLSNEHKLKVKMNNPLRKDICEYEIGTDKLLAEYISVREASKKTGHTEYAIISSCKGLSTPDKFGVYWRYKDNYFPYEARDLKPSEETIQKIKLKQHRNNICQYEIGTDRLLSTYESSYDAERITGINRSHIMKCCRGIKNYNSVGGYYWRFEDNYFPYEPPANRPIKIEQYDKNGNLIKIYNSTYELRKELKIDFRAIIKNNYDYLGYDWKIKK